MKLSKLKFLFGSTASSHLLQNRLNWILKLHVFRFSTSLANSSPSKTYASAQLLSRYSWVTKEAICPFQFYTSFAEHPRLLLQD